MVTIDAALSRKAAVRFYDLLCRNSCTTFEGIDILCEAHVEEAMVKEKLDEGMSKRGTKGAGVEFRGEGVD